MRVFVTGVSGQLGHDVINEVIRCGYEGIGSDIFTEQQYYGENDACAPYVCLDITDRKKTERIVSKINPDVIIHCAAWTNVDLAEEETMHENVWMNNVGQTENLSFVCKKIDCKLIYISTDYVFGESGNKLLKPDCENLKPLNFYGKSKLQGEKVVAQSLEKYYIVRTSWMFGINGNNFVNKIIRSTKKHGFVEVVDDQIGRPTYTVDFARLLIKMAETEKYGIYHATNEGENVSRYDFACEILKQAKLNANIIPIKTLPGINKANRPLNGRLDTGKLVENGFVPMPIWKDALNRYLYELRHKNRGL